MRCTCTVNVYMFQYPWGSEFLPKPKLQSPEASIVAGEKIDIVARAAEPMADLKAALV